MTHPSVPFIPNGMCSNGRSTGIPFPQHDNNNFCIAPTNRDWLAMQIRYYFFFCFFRLLSCRFHFIYKYIRNWAHKRAWNSVIYTPVYQPPHFRWLCVSFQLLEILSFLGRNFVVCWHCHSYQSAVSWGKLLIQCWRWTINSVREIKLIILFTFLSIFIALSPPTHTELARLEIKNRKVCPLFARNSSHILVIQFAQFLSYVLSRSDLFSSQNFPTDRSVDRIEERKCKKRNGILGNISHANAIIYRF